MSVNVAKFNRTFGEFVSDLISVFPNDTEFRMVQLAITGLQFASPCVLQEGFHERVVVPFGDKILARDEGFFLDADYSKETADVEDAAQFIQKVKHMYRQMKEDDRAVVWKYMRVLVLLSNKIASP
jgi:hypothetical protein